MLTRRWRSRGGGGGREGALTRTWAYIRGNMVTNKIITLLELICNDDATAAMNELSLRENCSLV